MANKPTLKAIEGPLAGETFIVEDGYTIGRDDACELTTQDKSTSRKHAQISIDKDGVRVADVGSANGLFVNERQIKSTYLKEGDEIVMGDTKFEFSIPADPKAQRRKFLGMLAVIIALGAAGLFGVLQYQKEVGDRTRPITRQFTQTFESEKFGFEVAVPLEMDKIREREFVVRKWEKETFGRDAPVLCDRRVTDMVVLDDYFQVRWFEWIDSGHVEWLGIDIEVWDGLAEFQDIYDFPLSDTSLPTRRNKNMLFTEAQTKQYDDAELGPYQEGELTYPKGVKDDYDRDVQAYVRSRVYVIGKRRYLLSVETNLKDKDRTTQVFDDFFKTFKATAEEYPERSDEQILGEGQMIMTQARKERITGTPNALYRSLISYSNANRKFKQLDARTNDFDESLEFANSIHRELTELLENRRNLVREQISRQQFDSALLTLGDITAVVEDSDDKDETDENDPWRIWHEEAKRETIERKNRQSTIF